MSTREKVFDYIKERQRVTVGELVDNFNISRWAIYKHLNTLIKEDKITKTGKPPRVFYLVKKGEKERDFLIGEKDRKIIEENYLIITPSGERKEGVEGFAYWCNKNNLDASRAANEYVKTFEKYNSCKKNGVISGNEKFQNTFKDVFLDDTYYLDFYSIERFGKTKLGQLLLYGKQSGNKKIIKEIVEIIKPKVERIIKRAF